MNNNYDDYKIVCEILEHISLNFQEQPSLEKLGELTGIEPTKLQKIFTRWAGISPKEFVQALTLDYAKKLLDEGNSILDTSYEVGLSGAGRLHDLFITHEAMSPGDYKTKGEGMEIQYGFHESPFGTALVMSTDRGLAGLAFVDGNKNDAYNDMTKRWVNAQYNENQQITEPYIERIFNKKYWNAEQPLNIILIGTDFQIRVWQGLLKIPMGCASTYSALAQNVGSPKAARAVGAAVGRNPISFVVPCHRIIGKSGDLTGYHWGLTRKRAMLGWEAGMVN